MVSQGLGGGLKPRRPDPAQALLWWSWSRPAPRKRAASSCALWRVPAESPPLELWRQCVRRSAFVGQTRMKQEGFWTFFSFPGENNLEKTSATQQARYWPEYPEAGWIWQLRCGKYWKLLGWRMRLGRKHFVKTKTSGIQSFGYHTHSHCPLVIKHSYWKWPSRNSGFTHWKWWIFPWFSIVMLVITGG